MQEPAPDFVVRLTPSPPLLRPFFPSLQCAALNSGIPMPVRCAFPQGQAIQDFAIGVVAVNGAGDSSIDSASMTKFGDNPTGCVSSFSASAGQAQSQMECVHEDCLKWSCAEWCECWDETFDYSSVPGCDGDDEPCDWYAYASLSFTLSLSPHKTYSLTTHSSQLSLLIQRPLRPARAHQAGGSVALHDVVRRWQGVRRQLHQQGLHLPRPRDARGSE